MSNSALTLEQVFEEVGWTAKWEAKGRVQGEAIGKAKFAKNLLADGFSIEKTAKLAELDIEKVRALSGWLPSRSVSRIIIKKQKNEMQTSGC